MKKIDLINQIKKDNEQIIHWVQEEANGKLNEQIFTDRWTIAGHIYHLIKSQRAILYGMEKPKIFLRFKFGTNKRQARNIDSLTKEYTSFLATGFKAPQSFSAKAGRVFIKSKLLFDFQFSTQKLIDEIDNWSEKKLDKYVLPHPALGKLSIRELLLFNILHNKHHFDILKNEY